jgi:UDP-glucuronate decarboxylase
MDRVQKRILVTGGAGFIGSHLCERLVAQGHDVLCVDNLFTGSKRNIQHLNDAGHFEFLRHDVTLPLSVEVDAVVNLACPASPIHYQLDPIKTSKTAFLGTLHMLGLAKRLAVPMLQASTSEVYGDPIVHPQSEDYWGNVNPIGVRSCYDEGKRCAETLCFDYNRQHGVQIKVARIFNTYGPRMHVGDGRVVSNFVVQALRGESIRVYGDGSQTRSFCYVNDMVEALNRLLFTPEHITGPINLGRSEEFTIAELAELVVEMTNSRSTIEYFPLPCDDPRKRKPDLSLSRAVLDWEATTSLRGGLRATIEYFDRHLAGLGPKAAWFDHAAPALRVSGRKGNGSAGNGHGQIAPPAG